MSATDVRYLVFDVESVADPELVAKLRYPGEQVEPAGLGVGVGEPLDVLEAVVRREDRQRGIGGGEPAVAVIGRTADADGRRQGLAARAQEVLGPGPQHRVLHGAALLEAGADANTTLRGGESVLMTAARTGRIGPVKALLARGAA